MGRARVQKMGKLQAIVRLFEGCFLVYYHPESEWRMRGKSTDSVLTRDILEWHVPEEVLVVLLKDHSTGRNIERGKEAS